MSTSEKISEGEPALPGGLVMSPERAALYKQLSEAMTRYAQGEDAAFGILYRGLYPRVRGFLLRMSADPTRTADLVQETFFRVCRARGVFLPGAPVVPWVLAIARNAYLDHLRREEAAGLLQASMFVDDDPIRSASAASPTPDGEQAALAREAARVVKAALAAMPVPQREVFVLLRFEGLSIAETAELLGTTQLAIKMRAFRAYEAVRTALKHRENGA